MTVAWGTCVHTARTVILHVSGTPGLFASFRRAGLRFHTIADMMPLSWHDGKSTANAVGCNHPPGFKSPILRSSQNTQGQGLTHQATQGRDSGCRRAQHEAGQGSQRFINAKTPQPRYSRRYRAYRAGLDASSARISSASSW